MAWTHYTAPLADGEELTAAMVAEVLAALDERLKAINSGWGVESAGAEEIALRASGLMTHRVYYTGPAGTSGSGAVTNTLAMLDEVVVRLSRYYQRPEPIEDNTGTTGAWTATTSEVLTAALVELGESITTPASWTAATMEGRVYWNMIRAALQLMRWVGLTVNASGASFWIKGHGVTVVGLAAAKAAYLAASETTWGGPAMVGSLSATRPPEAYGLEAIRFERAAAVVAPSGGVWATWTPALRLLWANSPHGGAYAPMTGRLSLGSQVLDSSAPATAGFGPWEALAGETGGVTLDLAMEPLGYATGDWIDELDAQPWVPWIPGSEQKSATAAVRPDGVSVVGRPNFTHP